MPNAEKVNCERCGGSGYEDFCGFVLELCPACEPTVKDSLTVASDVKDCLTTQPVSSPYKFGDGEVHTCWACGALPCDGGLQAWERLPWVVTLKESGGWRFLIDSRDPDNRDMFSGFKINAHGKIGEKSPTTGEGGRYNYHRSYFIEELPE